VNSTDDDKDPPEIEYKDEFQQKNNATKSNNESNTDTD
jgi:hypothetical protein